MPKAKKPVPEGAYIEFARRFVTANKAKNKAAREEAEAKKLCVQAMHAVDVKEFDFVNGNMLYHATLARPSANRVSVRKLYTMLQQGEITLDEFLDCISAAQKAVEETIGKAALARLIESFQKGLDLLIKPKGDD